MSAGENKTYRLYSSLEQPDSIRLLRLYPSPSPASTLQCELYSTTLSAYEDEIFDHYTAISYVWGNAQDTRHILVNGFRLRVTANLENALRDLRDETSIRTFWIDAICINQQDLTERALQVGLMSRIYSLALHTVIYLGPTDDILTDALSYLGNLPRQSKVPMKIPLGSYKLTSKYWDVEMFQTSLVPIYKRGGSQQLQQVTKFDQLEVSSKNVTLAKILERPWFTRVWVFQELVFSRDPWLQIGSISRIRWSDFCKSPGLDDGVHLNLSTTIWSGYFLLQGMNSARMRYDANHKPPLLDLLEGRRGLGVSDPRDMLFAHVGFSHEGCSDFRLQVDYRKTTEEVYTGIATYLLEQPQVGYNILSFVDDSSIPGGCPKRPTWVPDWTVSCKGIKRMCENYARSPNPALLKPQPSYFNRGGIVAARGISLGTIRILGKPMTLPPLCFDRNQEIKTNVKLAQQSDDDYHSYINHVISMRNDHHITSIYARMQEDKKNLEAAKMAYKKFTDHYKKKLEVLLERRARWYLEMYNYWRQELGAEILPPLNEGLEDIMESTGFDEIFGSIPPKMRDLQNSPLITESVIAHLVFAGSKSTSTNLIVNRRLARLDSGLLVLVPSSATVGDTICFLENHLNTSVHFHPSLHDIPFVLRTNPSSKNPELDAEILAADEGKLNKPLIWRRRAYRLGHKLWENPVEAIWASIGEARGTKDDDEGSSTIKLQGFQGAKIEHFTLVGEAFVDGMMLGRGRSKLYHGSWESMVFAIH